VFLTLAFCLLSGFFPTISHSGPTLQTAIRCSYARWLNEAQWYTDSGVYFDSDPTFAATKLKKAIWMVRVMWIVLQTNSYSVVLGGTTCTHTHTDWCHCCTAALLLLSRASTPVASGVPRRTTAMGDRQLWNQRAIA
jgi:hypothetical protein